MIDRVGINDRADRIVKIKMLRAAKSRIDSESGSEVRGPLAMTTIPSCGISVNFLANEFDVGIV